MIAAACARAIGVWLLCAMSMLAVADAVDGRGMLEGAARAVAAGRAAAAILGDPGQGAKISAAAGGAVGIVRPTPAYGASAYPPAYPGPDPILGAARRVIAGDPGEGAKIGAAGGAIDVMRRY